MFSGFHGDLETWILDCDIEKKIFRIWLNSWSENAECIFAKLTTIIPMPDGRIFIGYSAIDSEYENGLYPYIDYEYLDNIHLAYVETDQNRDEDEDQ
jgi:hypothetical protein